MSLKDLTKLTFAESAPPPEGTKYIPSDYGTLTIEELHRVYVVARERVTLHSPIFQSLVMSWEVSPTFNTLMLHLSARVRNRDDLVSISDNELRENMREAARYGEYPRASPEHRDDLRQ